MEMKYAPDTIRDRQVMKDVSLLKFGALHPSGLFSQEVRIKYVFIADPVSGKRVSQEVLNYLDTLGIEHEEWGWEFWSLPPGSMG